MSEFPDKWAGEVYVDDGNGARLPMGLGFLKGVLKDCGVHELLDLWQCMYYPK